MIKDQNKSMKKAEVELLFKLELRKKVALNNSEKFKNNKKVFNSFIKFSNNIQDEIDNLKINKIKIKENIESVNSETILDLLPNNMNAQTFEYSKYNSIDEDNELDEYIKIYKKYSFKEHYEVNHYITNNKLWTKFPNIRSLNDHARHKGIPGILPKFYAQICDKLKIVGSGGSPLDQAVHY